jgi:SAM-dependent methyltransferase
MTSRIDLLNYLIEKGGYQKYLEIGCAGNECFNAVKCPYKVGVDPANGGTVRCTSDNFFALCHDTFDLVFIDGLHECQQVNRDISNSLKVLRPGGAIVLHDCNPTLELEATFPPDPARPCGNWNGDVWKTVVLWRTYTHVDTFVGDFDWGCGLILPQPNTSPISLECSYINLPWAYLQEKRASALRLQTFEELKLHFERYLNNRDVSTRTGTGF